MPPRLHKVLSSSLLSPYLARTLSNPHLNPFRLFPLPPQVRRLILDGLTFPYLAPTPPYPTPLYPPPPQVRRLGLDGRSLVMRLMDDYLMVSTDKVPLSGPYLAPI